MAWAKTKEDVQVEGRGRGGGEVWCGGGCTCTLVYVCVCVCVWVRLIQEIDRKTLFADVDPYTLTEMRKLDRFKYGYLGQVAVAIHVYMALWICSSSSWQVQFGYYYLYFVLSVFNQ